MIDVNTTGLTNTIELILPYMRVNKFGTIINISSLSDRVILDLKLLFMVQQKRL